MIKIYKTDDSYLIAVDNEIPPFSLKGVFNFLNLHFNVEILHKPPYKSAEGVLFTPSAKIVFTSSVDIEEVEKLLRKRFTNTRIVCESTHHIEKYDTFRVWTTKGVSYVRFLKYPHHVNFGKKVIATNGLFVVEKSNTEAANFFKKKLTK